MHHINAMPSKNTFTIRTTLSVNEIKCVENVCIVQWVIRTKLWLILCEYLDLFPDCEYVHTKLDVMECLGYTVSYKNQITVNCPCVPQNTLTNSEIMSAHMKLNALI